MFVEVATGAIQNRGVVVKTTLLNQITDFAGGEVYNSYYEFDEELISHLKIRKTVRGFRGKYYLDYPIIDIDKGTDTDEFVLQRTRIFLERLYNDFNIHPVTCQIYFSGRGFHVMLPNVFSFKPSETLPGVVRAVMEKFFPEGDNIYDGARLIRSVNSINAKSNLYKIRLLHNEIYDLAIEDIKTLAKTRRYISEPDADEYSVPNLSNLLTLHIDTAPINNEAAETSNIATCIQKMYNEGPVEGTRHNKMLRMTTSWRRAGIPKDGIIAMLTSWATNMEPYEIKRIVDDIFTKGYHPYKCSDRLMSNFCDTKCIFYKNKNYTTEVINSIDAEKAFVQFVNSNLEERAFDLNEIYYCASYKFYPGEAVAVIGDTKLGKSTFIQNICWKLNNRKILYLPLENAQHLAYRRFIQMAHSMTRDEVIEHYKTNQNGLSNAIKHISMVVLPPTIPDLRKIIIEHKPDIVVIDTIDGIDVPNIHDDTIKTSILGVELKNLAQQLDIIIIAIVHISKSAAIDQTGRQKTINIHSSKGSTAIPQKFDKVLAWEGDRDGQQRYLTSLGARDEENIRLSFIFNYNVFRMEQQGI